MTRTILALAVLLQSAACLAQSGYKCTDASGQVSFQDLPCVAGKESSVRVYAEPPSTRSGDTRADPLHSLRASVKFDDAARKLKDAREWHARANAVVGGLRTAIDGHDAAKQKALSEHCAERDYCRRIGGYTRRCQEQARISEIDVVVKLSDALSKNVDALSPALADRRAAAAAVKAAGGDYPYSLD